MLYPPVSWAMITEGCVLLPQPFWPYFSLIREVSIGERGALGSYNAPQKLDRFGEMGLLGRLRLKRAITV